MSGSLCFGSMSFNLPSNSGMLEDRFRDSFSGHYSDFLISIMDGETVTDSPVGLGLISHLINIEWLLSVCVHSPVVNFDDSCLKVPPPGILIRH